MTTTSLCLKGTKPRVIDREPSGGCVMACCVAMVGSVTNAYITEDDDSEIDDPIEARYALGYERGEVSHG